MPSDRLDGAIARAWVGAALDGLAGAREEIDALNVYPVPDGDTGTNLFLTVEAASEVVDELPADAELAAVLPALARAALLGARGNSGVILSQMFKGFADAMVGRAGAPADVAAGLRRAADAAYDAVANPVEGTMLSVLRAAAVGAEGEAASAGHSLDGVVAAAAEAAAVALEHTTEQLEVLRRAGVVDAGGRGVCVLLDALVAAVTGQRPVPRLPAARTADRHRTGEAEPDRTEAGVEDDEALAGGPAYEVMFLLDAPSEAVTRLRTDLARLGNSLVVVGGDPTWNVHVHVDDVGAAVEAGIAAGIPHRIRVTDLRDGVRARRRREDAGVRGDAECAGSQRGVVSVVAGEGLGAVFAAAGATVVPGGPGRRASTAELLAGMRQSGARDLIVLPNDGDSLGVAEAAAEEGRLDGLRVGVIPTRASVQALAAMAVHDPTRAFHDDVVAMTAAANHCRHGGVTVASRAAVTMAGVCQPGDVLGIVDGDFAVIGQDIVEVACTVVDRMLGSGGELVTLVTGTDAEPGLADAVLRHVRRSRPEADTVVYEGGQPRYPLLVGVE